MAVLNELPGIKVTIEVNDVKAQEYNDEDGPAEDKNNRRATNRCFKYIESKDDSPFSVVYHLDNTYGQLSRYDALGIYLSIDGAQMDSCLWESARYPPGSPVWTHRVAGTRHTSAHSRMDSMRKFKFSKITTIDDAGKDRVARDIEDFKRIGLIKVYVYGCSVRENRPTHRSHRPTRDKDFEVAEKALKDALHKELVILRSPTPEGINALSEAEIRRLAAERLEDINHHRRSPTLKREPRAVIKREFAEYYDLTEEPTKREWKKVRIDDKHKAIDLTDD
ncbi:hypothetical protein COL26b_003604 [Colletotrichum chrysophilum]|uniref:uncharacterized protein n=1 Tax=Colletotrichum chrysophilum TaxID=1836956 RepID=UPI0023002B66|nr:uncharacterized protein COL26b_003604 [Colletotrichum chrysophilum]KAJ0346375.1 hypothetical protein KNSL1_007482 [Colletotrichum chrysophilum]KAJ0378177.1 hypothetical protein COL26b_003604 [Colletotrichum chrysophilum]